MIKQIIVFVFFSCIFNVAFAQKPSDEEVFNHNRWVRDGTAYYRGKNFPLALTSFEKAIQTSLADKNDYYNAACCASLVGNFEKAALYLTKSIDKGFWDVKWIVEDVDFENFRKDDRWGKAIQHLQDTILAFEKQFEKVKGIPLTDLVPYQQNAKWGYLQKHTRKIIVPANFQQVSFAGNCLKIKINETLNLGIDSNGKLIVKSDSPTNRFDDELEVYEISSDVIEIDSTPTFKGFALDEEGSINRVSSLIDQEDGYPIVLPMAPIKIDGGNYTVARKKGKYGLLSQDGSSHPKVGFMYKNLEWVYCYKGEGMWFFFQDGKNKFGYIHSSGEQRFYGEIDSLLSNQINYNLLNFNYAGVCKGKNCGIIDLSKMEWVIKPLPSVEFLNIAFTIKEDYCDLNRGIPIDRSKIVDFYFLAKDKNGQIFYLDKEGIKYTTIE